MVKKNSTSFPILLLLVTIVLLFMSCGGSNDSSEPLAPIQPTLKSKIISFEDLLQNLPQKDLLKGFKKLSQEHPHFSKLYVEELIAAPSETSLLEELKLVQGDTSYQNLGDEVQKILGDLSDVKPEIDQALENYLKVFSLSSDQLPDIYTFISGFTYQAFLFDNGGKSGIGLGLEMFLGEDFPYQKIHPANPSFSKYLTRTYNKKHLIRKMVEVLVEDQLAPPRESNFLSFIIWGGKKLYLIDKIMNFAPNTVITEYTPEELKWCQDNEEKIWQFFFEKNLFFETDIRKFNKLISPAPTSPGMPSESPGQTGNYIGWQIIKQYMLRYPNTSVKELLSYNDSQQLLDLSRYKPTR